MKRQTILTTAVLVFVLSMALVSAAPDDATSTEIASSGIGPATAANAVTAEGGNVTTLNVSSSQTTNKWQGFYGNVSGGLQLGDGSDIFYDWSAATFQAIYAALDVNVDFSTVSDIAGTASKAAKDVEFGFTGNEFDSINKTMTGAACSAGTIFAAADGVSPFNNLGAAGAWETCIGEDVGAALDDTVFGTDVIDGGSTAFNGDTAQYQLMVPVIAAGDNYYFFLEI